MYRKGLLSLIVALVLCTSVISSVTVHAENGKSAGVAYRIDETYTWAIHTLVDFSDSNGEVTIADAVVVTESIIPDDKRLSIAVSRGNSFEVSDGKSSLVYQVFETGNENTFVTAGEEVLGISSGTSCGSVSLSFRTSGQKKISGYTGTISYVAKIVP